MTIPPSSCMTRRMFVSLALGAAAGTLSGCAVNPVTGQSQLMLMSRDQEIQVDRERSPHQFSADYGVIQDRQLGAYISQTGKRLASLTHRSDMPYSFQGVNAAYVNAYAFPGGSIAVTRGILVEMEDEAELAALLGHELGHVNARHTAQQMTKGVFASAILAGAGIALSGNEKYAPLISGLGGMGAGLLLAKYSRDNERQADDLGMEYMVKAGYSPQGMINLQDMLVNLSSRQPSALETMFSTHPMSRERLASARQTANSKYSRALGNPVYKERYMDTTAGLRKIKPALKAMQEGEKHMARKDFSAAEKSFGRALDQAPQDYAALVMMSKCLLAQDRPREAEKFAQKAEEVFPQEAQASYFQGVAQIGQKDYQAALRAFSTYERLLPGNPMATFLQGLSLEGMGRKESAASRYRQFLSQVNQGKQAQYAYSRLKEWGYIR
ncbi:MAG: M48 family metalloprotease [Desulfovermiculus sp.]|nr:M48 family metalloprotease [Desulfovermiculus sp.]